MFAWIPNSVKSLVRYNSCTPLAFVSPLFLYALVQLYDIHIHIHHIHVLGCNVHSLLWLYA
jgi:hypothetical protein